MQGLAMLIINQECIQEIKMKITKQKLKQIIKEELTAVEKVKKAELEKKLTGIAGSRGISKTMNKGAQDKIEKELDGLKHK